MGNRKNRNTYILLTVLFMASLLLLLFLYKIERKTVGYETKTLKLGITTAYEPYCYRNDAGEPVGFDIDVIRAIALETGFNVEFIEIPKKEALISMLCGEVDAVLGVDYTHVLPEYIKTSEPFLDSRMAIFLKRSTSQIKTRNDLKNKKVSIYKNDPYMDLIKDIEGIRIFQSDTVETAVQLMLLGITDAFVGDEMIGNDYMMSINDDQFIKATGEENTDWITRVVTINENEELIDMVDVALKSLTKKDTLSTIKNKWFGQSINSIRAVEQFIYLILIFFATIIGVMIISYRVNSVLKKEVAIRTKKLSEEKKLKESVINSIFDGLIAINTDGTIVSANPSAEIILGQHDTVIGKNIYEISNADIFQRKHLQHAISEKTKLIKQEGSMLIEGEKRTIEYNITPVLSDEKTIYGITITFRDTTEEKNMMKKITSKDKLETIGRLTAGIAHEIRNPLTSINMYMTLLPQKFNNEAFRIQVSEDIPKEIKRLDDIIKGLLDYAKPRPPKIETMDLNREVNFIIRLLRSQIEEHQIKIEMNIEKDIFIKFDKAQFKQIIINIVINAIDAVKGRENPIISMKTEKRANQWWIIIEDNGCGMPLEDVKKIFEPFYSTKDNGYGLGLAIVEQLIKENHAEIEIESVVEKGTRFEIGVTREWEEQEWQTVKK